MCPNAKCGQSAQRSAVIDGHLITQPEKCIYTQREVFEFLQNPRTHGLLRHVERINTHGAAVFLAGDDVYKVKRAVKFSFMDFSTLEKRREACENEIAVNRDNAPNVYLGVVPITRTSQGLALAGEGVPVEWAVHMRRFNENATLDAVACRNGLSTDVVDRLADAIVGSHERAPRRDGSNILEQLSEYIVRNDAALRREPSLFSAAAVEVLSGKARVALADCRRLLAARAQAGFVRRCHGDLHLGNIALIEGMPVLFDAVEFDDRIATCDLLYDLAFLLMDLEQKGLRQAANRLLNRYLSSSAGEHLKGLAALPLFMSLRGAIRAMVLAAGLQHQPTSERPSCEAQARHYFEVALDLLRESPPSLLAVGGLSGTGKSTIAAALAPTLGRAPGAIVLRSDVERKHLFGVADTRKLPAEAYRHSVTAMVYEQLARQVREVLLSGHSVVVDAVHSMPDERQSIEDLAAGLHVPFTGIWLEAPLDARLARVARRRGDASDADAAVVKQQATHRVGNIGWHRIDAAGPLHDTIATARRVLGSHAGTKSELFVKALS